MLYSQREPQKANPMGVARPIGRSCAVSVFFGTHLWQEQGRVDASWSGFQIVGVSLLSLQFLKSRSLETRPAVD